MIDIVLTTNSPGEVSSWVKPVVKKLNELNIDKNIYVFTPPCVFSSGNEGRVLSELEGIKATFDSRQYLKYILFNIKPNNFNPSNQGFVLFLGGDFMHAVFLGKKLNYPVYSYTERDFGFKNSVEKFYLSDQHVFEKLKRKGVNPTKLKVVGNLMFDSVDPKLTKEETKQLLNKDANEIIINLLPGSRPKEFNFVLPLYLNYAVELSRYDKDIKFILSKAAFVDDRDIYKIIDDKRIQGNVEYREEEKVIKIEGVEIKIFEDNLQSIMRDSDLAVTIPGTNNLELAVLQTPMLVILPLNKPELIPLPGLVGLIGEIPFIGKLLKKQIVPKLVEKREYISLVNMMADKELVPELIGDVDSKLLAEKTHEIITSNKISDIKNTLAEFEVKKGAAETLVKDILKDMGYTNLI